MPRPKKSDTSPISASAPKLRGLLGRFFRSTVLLQPMKQQYLMGQITEFVLPDSYLVQSFTDDGNLIKGQVLVPGIALHYSTIFYDSFQDFIESGKPSVTEASPAPKTTIESPAPAVSATPSTAPLPADGTPPSHAPAALPSEPVVQTDATPTEAGPVAPKQRVCRVCEKPGHNARTCPKAKGKEAEAPPDTAAEAPKEEDKKGQWQKPQELTNPEPDGTPSDEDYEEGNAEEAPTADIIAALDKLHPLIGTLGIISVRTGPGTVIIEVNGDTSEVEGILTKTEEGFECCGMPVEFLTFSMEGQEEEEEETPVEEKGHADAHPF